jgi:alpha-L-rhamnosidase
LWAALNITNLRCEYRENPLGIDAAQPRLSWVLESNQRAEKQMAYRILVAASSESLAQNRGDLWDSGKVNSDQTIHVEYAGKPLASRMQCFWKIQVWDKAGEASAWSKPALWTMGLLNASDWDAKWIADATATKRELATPHNGYLSTAAKSADTVKWVAIDLGGDRRIDAVRLDPARPENTPNTSAYLFPVRPAATWPSQ